MKISATIDTREYDFFVIPPEATGGKWSIQKMGDPDNRAYGSFDEESGVINNLEIDGSIATSKEIVLERLREVLKDYTDTIQMGFEGENEETGLDTSKSELSPYDPELIRVRPMVLSAFQVNMDISKGIIDLNPEFQRNFVWDDTRKSRLIESMLLKIPLPAFYFSEDNKGNYQVVDGLQRLTVISSFFRNEFRLKGLEYLTALEGKFYEVSPEKKITAKDALNEIYASRVQRTQLNINVIEASSPLRVKYDIFFRINTGGRPLNHQEIRNCFASGTIRRTLKRMANNPLFAKSTGNSIKDIRMDAQELALRFLGFMLFRDSYAGEMNSFLDDVLDKLNGVDQEVLDTAEQSYYKALENAYRLFGNYAFRKILPKHLETGARRQLINKAMFIVWSVILAKPNIILSNNGYGFLANILANELEKNSNLFNALTTGTSDKSNLDFVFKEFQQLLDNYLNSQR